MIQYYPCKNNEINVPIGGKSMKQKEMTILKLFTMTVLPSAILIALYIIIGMLWQGIPSLVLFMILSLMILFVFEIGVLLSANKKEYGNYGVKIAFSNLEHLPWWKIFIYAFVLFGFAGLMSITIGPLEDMIMSGVSDKLYALLPAYFDWTNIELMKQYSKGMLILTSILYITCNVFIFPIIEEIYFRGYLTNALKSHGILAPILVTIAFSLYHWWLPFNNIFRICAFIIVAIIAYKKKNIYISIVFHCLCNLLSSISFVVILLG